MEGATFLSIGVDDCVLCSSYDKVSKGLGNDFDKLTIFRACLAKGMVVARRASDSRIAGCNAGEGEKMVAQIANSSFPFLALSLKTT